uniref:Protein KRTCAP2 homolog n=1 Tax=Rhizophora mucronata TaxID=61149 RepID=A0A2P2INJ7_RHIMU
MTASTVHRVCITTCFVFSSGLLYEVNKLSGTIVSKSESKARRHWQGLMAIC